MCVRISDARNAASRDGTPRSTSRPSTTTAAVRPNGADNILRTARTVEPYGGPNTFRRGVLVSEPNSVRQSLGLYVNARAPSATSPTSPRVKGVAFRSVLASLTELRGQPAVNRVLKALSDEDRSALEYRVVQTGWYPVELYRTLLDAIALEANDGDSVIRAIGGASIRRDVTGVYRAFFKILSPESVLTLSGRLFSVYYDTGSLSIAASGPGYARCEYQGCRGFDRHMWLELEGSSESLLQLAGARSPKARILRGGDGEGCTIEARWS